MQETMADNVLDACERAVWLERVKELVSLPSPSSPGGGCEGQVQKRVADWLREAGARVWSFEADDFPEFFTHPLCCGPERQYAGRPTVVAELGPSDGPAMLIMAHSDTVCTYNEPERWTHGPFTPVEKEGRLIGRGAGDDKWGVAGLVTLAQYFAQKGNLQKRLIFASTIDEENGVGNGLLLLLLAGLKPEGAIYLDGCDENILIGNLGGTNLYLRPRHALDPKVIQGHVEKIQVMVAAYCSQELPRYEADPLLRKNARRGQSLLCRLDHDVQGPVITMPFITLPGDTREGCCKRLESELARVLGPSFSEYECSYREPWFEPTVLDVNEPLVRYVVSAYAKVTQREPVITTVAKQDAFVLRQAGIPVVSIGAGITTGPGAQHLADEYLQIDSGWRVVNTACKAVETWLEA